jgi:hypothetical protein
LAGGHPPAIKGNNGGAGRLQNDCVAVAPSYGRVLREFRIYFFGRLKLFDTQPVGGRHCEEHLRRSNPVFASPLSGLLRFARNDGGSTAAR